MKTFKEFITEEGEAPLTTTSNVEPKDQPNIRNESNSKKKKKKKTGPKNWVAIGPNYRWGYANYGLGGYYSGESLGNGDAGDSGRGM